jgi:colanic acid biosynthesis glycosyl transferase WcaI
MEKLLTPKIQGNKRFRVLLLTQWFDPEPTFKGLAFARELMSQGFDVEVLTGFPNYPGGKIYSGYRLKLIHREVLHGVQITRLPLYPSHDHSVIKRVLNYTSFAASAMVYGILAAHRANVVYAYHPPLTVGAAAALIKLFRKIPVVYDIQDLWPDTLRATGMLKNARLLALVGRMCYWVYRLMDHIVVLSPGFKRILIQRGVPEHKLSVIYNWADEDSLAIPPSLESSKFQAPIGQFRILFAGNIGKAQALDTVLQAAALLKTRQSNICWAILGSGVELKRIKVEAMRQGLTNVAFFPRVPMSEVSLYLRAADVLLVHLRKDPLFEITIPSKVQAYMKAGKPLLMAVDGDAADLVRRSDSGLVVCSENPEELAYAAERMAGMPRETLERMGHNAQIYYHKNLSLAQGVKQFSDIFRLVSKFS